MTAVVIAAHNEEAVLGRCLDALLAAPNGSELDITVVANGCTDATAAVAARRPGVRVVELEQPGKAGALNAGDAVAVGYPRVYLDADVVLTDGGLAALVAALTSGPVELRPLAVVPRRVLELAGRPLPVRAYYAINSRHPAYADALFGRGAIALSEAGRARFGQFPAETADDLFLDSLFTPAQKREVAAAGSVVATPRRTADLVRRLARVRAGNAALRARADGSGAAVRPAAPTAWLRRVVLPRPWLAPAAVGYVAITLAAGARARRGTPGWERDDSSRTGADQVNR